MVENPLAIEMSSCRRAFALIAVLSLCINVLMLSSAIYMMQVYDRVLTTRNIDTLLVLSMIVVFALVVLAIFDGLRTQLMVRIGGWLDGRLSDSTLASSISVGLVSGGTSAQGLRDLSSLKGYIGSPSVFPLFDAPFAPVFLLTIFLIHPMLGWISTIGAVILFALGVINNLVTSKVSSEANGSSVSALNFANSAVRNADVIVSMGILPGLTRRFQEVSQVAYENQRTATDRSGLLGSSAKGLRFMKQFSPIAYIRPG